MLDCLHVLAALLQGLFELAVIVHDIVHVRDAREDLRHAVRLKNEGEIRVAVVFLHGADALAQQRRLLGLRGGRRGKLLFLAVDKLLINGDLLFNERDRLPVERDLLIKRRFAEHDQRLVLRKPLYDLLLFHELLFKLRTFFRQPLEIGLVHGVRRKNGDDE